VENRFSTGNTRARGLTDAISSCFVLPIDINSFIMSIEVSDSSFQYLETSINQIIGLFD